MSDKLLGIETRVLRDVFTRSDELQQYEYAVRTSGSYTAALSLIERFMRDDPQARAVGFNLLLARKGIVLDSQARYQEALAEALPPALQTTWNHINSLKATRAKLERRRPPALSLTAYRERLAALTEEIANLESTLASHSRLVAEELTNQSARLDDVARRLPRDAVWVEIVKIQDWDWEKNRWAKTARYVAFLLYPNRETNLVKLGEADHLEQVVTAALADLRREPWSETGTGQLQAAERLYALLWQPLRSFIGDATTVLISPDGLLNLVPFAALRTPQGRFLIEDMTIMTITSGRDLVKGRGALPSRSALLLVADPAFDWHPSAGEAENVIEAFSMAKGEPQLKPFARLEATAEELIFIPPLVPGDEKIQLSREQATEDAVLAADRPRVLHLATHGFFLEDLPERLPEEPFGTGEQVRRVAFAYENPLLRSGLALTGANYAERIAESREGLLTALEVSGMNLHGTDLVVLSACDTGKGEVRTGEGVYGLRRSFALAGARNVVMTLWPVWDKQARKQMKTFYASYSQGVSPAHALRAAQLERIAWMRKYLGAAPPSLWAPFMVQTSGAPPLELLPTP